MFWYFRQINSEWGESYIYYFIQSTQNLNGLYLVLRTTSNQMMMQPLKKYYLKCFGNCDFGFLLFNWVEVLIDSEKWFSLAALASSLVNPLPEPPLWAMVGGKKKKRNSEN